MIDINSSLFIQLVNFIVLLLALNFILFKPLLRTMQEREQGIANAFTDAKTAQERVQGMLEQYTAALNDARQKAAAAYGAAYQQGLDAQRGRNAAGRATTGEQLNKARAEISAAAASARADLKKEAGALSQKITGKLFGTAGKNL